MASNNILIKDLIDFGLSEKEAEVYIALLELEVASVQEISRKTGVNRSSTYVVIESLKKKGLVAVSDDKSIQQFVASSPEILLRSAKEFAQKQKSVLERIEGIVPELKGLHKETKQKPKVRVFEGIDGLAAAFEDSFLIKEKVMRVYSSHEKLFKRLPKSFLNTLKIYIEERKKKGIKMKSMHPDNDTARGIVTNILPKTDEWVLIPEKGFEFNADLAIYDNKISYMSHENNGMAIIIESREIADVMKKIFDLAHKQARSVSKFKNTK